MGSRLQLHNIFKGITENVYFQPPEEVKISYPCIIYSRSSGKTQFANDNPYNIAKCYEVKVIDYDPDSLIPDKVATLPMCSFDIHYTADNLNHYVYKIYY